MMKATVFLFPSVLLLLGVAGALEDANSSTPTSATDATQAMPSGPTTTDGSCGPEHNGTVCAIDGVSPCCSNHGYCGSDKRYCDAPGCQALFGLCHAPNSSTLGNPACSWSWQGTSPRCDGHCGTGYNNARCDGSAASDAFEAFGVFQYGPCCSKSGFCGNTSDHCERKKGCQSGCWGGDTASSSSSTAKGPVSTVTVTTAAATAGAAGVRGASSVPDALVAVGLGMVGVMLGL